MGGDEEREEVAIAALTRYHEEAGSDESACMLSGS